MVRVVTAAEKETERTLFADGVLAARDQAALSVKVAGRLENIPVDVGSVVKRGETIGQIQKRDYELKVQQSKAAVSAARARLGLSLDGSDDSIEVKDSSVVKEARAQLDEQTKNRARIAKLHEQGILSESELESAESGFQVAVNKLEDALQETAQPGRIWPRSFYSCPACGQPKRSSSPVHAACGLLDSAPSAGHGGTGGSARHGR